MAPSFPSRRARRNAEAAAANGEAEQQPQEGAVSADEAGEQPPAESARKRRRRSAETLASVVKESTPGAAMDIIRSCKPFVLADGRHAAILMVTTEALGGLSLKNRDDADKGSIIELIRADHITTLATKSMIAGEGSVPKERFGIIPTKNTLERMEEYRLLVEAQYYWAIVTLDGSMDIEELDGAKAEFRDTMLVQLGVKSIDELITEARSAAPVALFDQSESVVDVEPASTGATVVDDGSYDDEASFAADETPFAPPTVQSAPPAVEQTPTIEDAPVVDDDDDDVEEEESDDDSDDVIEDDGIVVEAEEVRSTIARRFFERDLDLVIDMAPFNAFVDEHFAFEPFEAYEADGDWLTPQLNGVVMEANADLRAHRDRHIAELRESYIELMTEHIKNIDKTLSTSDETRTFGRLTKANQDAHQEDLRRVDSLTAARRNEIMASYNELLEQAAINGANMARQRYNETNRPRLDRQLADLSSTIVKEIDDIKVSRDQAVQMRRRDEAQQRLDLGASMIMSQLIEHRAAQRDDELDIVNDWNNRLAEYIDNYRADGLAVMETNRAFIASNDEIEKKKAQFDAEMDSVKAANAERVAVLSRQLEEGQARFEAELASRELEWTSRLASTEDNAKSANERVVALTNRLEQLRDEYEAEYAPQLASKSAEVAAAQSDAQRVMQAKDQTIKILVGMAALLLIVAVFIGTLIGLSMN